MRRVLHPGGLLALVEPNNVVQSLIATSQTSYESVDVILRRVRFQLMCERGRKALGEGDFSLGYPGYKLEPDDPAAKLLYVALRGLGMTPDPHPGGGGTDGNVFRGKGIASVVIGRGGYNQHTREEYLVIPEMLECARVVEAVVLTVARATE